MNDSGYPSKKQLKIIRTWDGNWHELLIYVQGIWNWGEEYCDYKSTKDLLVGRTVYEWNISTGGWSGNEDIIAALSKNMMFWIMCWYSSQVGGHYIFKVVKESEK